jgi:hypothetical protein
MTEKSRESVPALENDEVTGMTEKRQKKVIRESARALRDEAAKEFLEEQAGETGPRRGRGNEE